MEVATLPLDLTDREAVLEQLVGAHGNSVLQLAYFYLKDRDLAEDVFQEVFTRVYMGLDRFRGDSSPKTWICRITINLCRDKLRSWSLRRVLLLGEELVAGARDAGPDVEDEVLDQADKEAILQAIMTLPLEHREVILLYYYEELECREVAAALGLSEGTVRSRLHRGRQKLKAILTEGGAADD